MFAKKDGLAVPVSYGLSTRVFYQLVIGTYYSMFDRAIGYIFHILYRLLRNLCEAFEVHAGNPFRNVTHCDIIIIINKSFSCSQYIPTNWKKIVQRRSGTAAHKADPDSVFHRSHKCVVFFGQDSMSIANFKHNCDCIAKTIACQQCVTMPVDRALSPL